MPPLDVVALLLLLLFVVWGALRGGLRQALNLAVLAAAFPLARSFGPRIEGSVAKAVSLNGLDLSLLSWAVVFAGTLVVGGVLVAAASPLLGTVVRRGRVLGGLLGLAQGAVLMTVITYGILLAFPSQPGPNLVQTLAASRTARTARALGQGLFEVFPAPAWMKPRLEAVEARVGSA